MLEEKGLLFEPHKIDKRSDVESGFSKKVFFKQINDIYLESTKLLPNSSSIYMFWSNFCLFQTENKQKSLVVLAESLKHNPWIDERFIVYRQRKVMNEESSSESMDMLEFIMCESHMKKADQNHQRAIALQVIKFLIIGSILGRVDKT